MEYSTFYTERYETFMRPPYKGSCSCVSVIPQTPEGDWICKGSQTPKIDFIRCYTEGRVKPYECLLKMEDLYGLDFVNWVLSVLEDPTTTFYCNIYKGVKRRYYIIIENLKDMPKIFHYKNRLNRLTVDKSLCSYYTSDFITMYNSYMEEKILPYKNVVISGPQKLKCLKYDSNISRVGVLLYDIVDSKIVLLFGANISCGLSDFGGGVKPYENPFKALLREFKEECGSSNESYLCDAIGKGRCHLVHSGNEMMALVRVKISEIKFSRTREINSVYEMSHDELKSTPTRKFHQPIQKFIDYIKNDNILIGYEDSLINSKGVINIAEGKIIIENCDQNFISTIVEESPIPSKKLRGRIYE